MTMHQALAEVVRRDPRYTYEAYEFVFAALGHTQRLLKRVPREGEGEAGPQHHVTGPELLDGIRDLALREFGLMARTVFRLWGINKTDDFGEIVFNLVESNLMSKTDEDNRRDFQNVYDLDNALVQGFRIQLDEGE
jgi:uncharacterized repeat protein (TIGR04138 family)